MIKIKLTSVLVDDQDKALKFYTDVLGFVKHQDFPVGEFKWLTVISPGNPEIELLLEPNEKPQAQAYQKWVFEQGMPFMLFAVDNIQQEYERMKSLGVEFSMPPTAMGPITAAILNDTCGNWIQIYEG